LMKKASWGIDVRICAESRESRAESRLTSS
jgi:hypothetical protein